MKISMAIAGIAAIGAAAVTGGVRADTIEATFNGTNPTGTFNISHDGGGSSSEVQGGLFDWTRTGGTWAGLPAIGDFVSVCIETTENISGGDSYTYEVVDLADAPSSLAPGMGSAKAALLAELFGRFFDESMSMEESVKFQAATWEIVNDDGLDVDGGDFQIAIGGDVTSGLQSDVQSMLDALDGTGPTMQLKAMVGDGFQDQVFVVPAPGSLALIGLASLVGTRRRR